MVVCVPGGRLCALLLCIAFEAPAQISVVNGLAHFHPCGTSNTGEIVVANALDSAVTVLIEFEQSFDNPPISIPSEWRLAGGQQFALPYTWLRSDSSSEAVRLLIYALQPSTTSKIGGWTVQTQLRYAITLYRGCLTQSPETEVLATWDSSLTWHMNSSQFWNAKVQAYGPLGEALEVPFDLFLYPGRAVQQALPKGVAYVVARDARGHQIGCKKP